MKKIKYFMITGMLLASIGLAGCGKKSEDDITNKEIYQEFRRVRSWRKAGGRKNGKW